MPAGGLAVGVDLGGTKILAGLVDGSGAVVRSEEHPTPTGSQEELLQALDDAVEAMVEPGVVAVGVGVPSRVDQRTGRAVSSTNVPLAGVPLRDRLRERFGLPVGVDNDANAATIAEWRLGAGRGACHLVMLTLGTGVGGGLILDGRPYRGATGVGAELGHVVVEHDGPACQGTCTGRGHLETLASGRHADERARTLFGPGADARVAVRLAREGDAAARELLAAIGRRLGSAIGSFVNVFDPEVVVLGGGFAAAGELLLGPAREVALREALDPARDRLRIVPGELGASAGLVGAALVGMEAAQAAAQARAP